MVKIKVVQTPTDELEQIVENVVGKMVPQRGELENIFNNVFDKKQQEIDDKAKKESHMNKLLNPNKEKEHKHKEACPNCHSGIENLGGGVSHCKGCGSTTVEKGKSFLICDGCDGIVPETYLGTDKGCPTCGGNNVHRPKKQ